MKIKTLIAIFFLLLSKAHSAEVVSISPEGSVKNIQQVTVRFSTDMTALGDPRDTIFPFTPICRDMFGAAISTPESQSRWADSKNWSFDYAKPLSSGVRCEFTMKTELKDLKGDKVTSKNFYFSTSGPAIVSHRPQYESIEPEQYFVLQLDGAVDESSVVKNVYFEVAGINEKVGVTLIKGSDREEILKTQFESLYKKDPKVIENNYLVIAATRRFPEKAKVVLHWTKGVLSKTGIAVTDEQTREFTVLAPFTATFSCERTDYGQPCSPITDMRLEFSRQVRLKELKGITFSSGKDKWQAAEFKEVDSADPERMVYSLTFAGPFPEKRKFQISVPSKIKDDSGRLLSNAKEYPLTVETDSYSPLVKFSGRFGVVEWTTESMLPISVRNVEKNMLLNQLSFEGKSFNLSSLENAKDIISLYEKTMDKSEYVDLDGDPRNLPLIKDKRAVNFNLPKASGEHDFEMMGIPLKNPGFYVVEVESPRLGQALTLSKKSMFVATSVLVTNMGVHFKKGLESSLVWVTQLNTSKPISDAAISIRDCNGAEIAKGVTNQDGILKLGLLSNSKKSTCTEWENYFYVFAKKGMDLSFMRTTWNQGIESWRYQVMTDNSYERRTWGALVAHTVLDRTLFRPGETVQMKHILREHHQNGFSIASRKVWPKSVVVRHSGSGKAYNLPVNVDSKTGSSLNTFALSNEMDLGNYDIFLSEKAPTAKKNSEKDSTEDDYEEYDWRSKKTGSFIVSDFRLPLMAATVKIQGDTLVRTKNVKVDLSAHYLSGGPATRLNIETRSQFSPSAFLPDFPGWEEYSFFAEPLEVGFVKNDEESKIKAEDIRLSNMVLDDKGGGTLDINNLEVGNIPKKILVEMDYADPNGEVKTASSEKLIFPSRFIVGLRVDSWFGSSSTTKVLGVITDPESKLIKEVKYTIEAFKRERYSHRKRLVGGFYSYDSKEEIKSLGIVCSGTSDENGRFECLPKNLPAGSIELQAMVMDEKQAHTFARVSVSVLKDGEDNWWSSSDSDRIDILPSKKEYGATETAEFIVKTPFKEATALVTVEREGILDQFVTTLNRDNPVIKIPMKGSYAPNVFVSAVVVRGRIGGPKADFLVDLAKPVMKMGLSEIKVGWSAHKLKVDVATDKKKYNVRDMATVKIKLKTPSGEALPKDTEVILVALDEALLQLRSNASFDLLAAMMTKRGHGVETSSNLNQVIGRRHFGLKAKAPGGGGGLMDGPREKFDPLLTFVPNLKVNANGEVEAKIKLNDSISSFRIVAIAHAGANLFGTGQVNIVTNKDIILYSGFSPVARSGDKIDNVFTIRNTTEKVMKVQVEAKVKGIEGALPTFPVIELNPSEAKVMTLPIRIPEKTRELEFLVSVHDTEGDAHDELKVVEVLSPSVPSRILQATLFQLDKKFSVPVKQPGDALPGSGNVSVSSRATLVHGLSGVKSYMEEYPYNCLEQRTSKAIVLDDKKAIKKIIQDLPSFMDDNGLLKFFDWPQMCGSSQLTRYILDILDENKYVLPEDLKNQIISGLRNALNGKYGCRPWWTTVARNGYDDQEKILYIQTLSRYKRFDSKVLESINITPNLWSTETLINWIQILERERALPKGQELLKIAQTILRARMNFQGSMMTLQNPADWEAQWRLFTSNDQEAIGAFGVMMSKDGDDAGRMARGLITRLKRGHWDTTMANAWGMTIMRKFSDKFEKIPVAGLTQIEADEILAQVDWKKTPQGEKKLLDWPKVSQEKEVTMSFNHNGNGKPWIHVETSSAIPLKTPMNFGYTLKKIISPISQKVKGKWSIGDVVNVDLIVTANTAQTWVVLRDPLPSGASHLGTGLKGESAILAAEKKEELKADELDWPLEYEEKSFSHLTRYAGFLKAGTYKTSYRYRINSSGNFKLPPTRAEAMYAPEVFGELPNAEFSVLP